MPSKRSLAYLLLLPSLLLLLPVLALLLKALVNMYKKAPKGIIPYCIMIGSLVLSAVFQVNILYVIIACALSGLISSLIMARRVGK